MSPQIAFGNAPHIQLDTLIRYADVRTIPVECRLLPYAASEWPVVLELEKDSPLRNLLPPMLQRAMFIYAYVRGGSALRQLFGGRQRHQKNEKIRLNECGDAFLMIVCQDDGREEPVYLVASDDVRCMLQAARHPSGK